MISEITSVNELHKKGRIHRTLMIRMITLGIVSLVFLSMIVTGTIKHREEFTHGFYFVFFGFPVGFFIFSKIFKIKWDRVNHVINVRKFDPVGLIMLAFYWILRWYLGDVLGYFYHEDAIIVSSASLSLLFGLALGRLISMMIDVRKIHEDLRKAKLLK